MAILSFAHLKNKKKPAQEKKAPIAPSRTIQPVRTKETWVMSFARLKGKKKPAAVQEAIPETKNNEPRLFRIPVVMPTALLASVNYCQGCGRFLPGNGSQYGRCLREGDIDSEHKQEVWKVIPSMAPVSRCFYHLQQRK